MRSKKMWFNPRQFRDCSAISRRWMSGVLALCIAARAWGVDSAEGLQEVVVTASKRGEENVQSTPMAVQALTNQQLAQMDAVQVSDYAALIPGFSYQDNGPGDKRYAIRGVTSTGSGTVGVYLDDVVITGENSQDGGGQQPDVMLFDMDRVEVLKGPQGTTFGSSSMTGTIRFITSKPKLDEFAGSMRAGVITTTGGGVGSQVDGMVNLPLSDDRFAVRLAGFYLDQPGFVNNQFERNADETHVQAGRAAAKLAVTDDVTLSGMVMVQQTSADALSFYNTVDYDGAPIAKPGFYQADEARSPTFNRMVMESLVLDYRLGYGTLTVSGSRFQRDLDYTRDASLALQAVLGLDARGAGRSVIDYPKERSLNSFEARFASSWQGPVQLLLGLYNQREIRDFRGQILTADPTGFIQTDPTVYQDRTVHDELTEYAVFTELSWALTDRWKLTAGARGYDIRFREIADVLVNFGGSPGPGPGPLLSTTNSGVIGKFNLSYSPADHVLAYAQVSQGFRPGGVNDQTAADIAHVIIPAGFGSDSLVNYELGLKTSWLNNRLIANAAAYYIDWSQIQVQELASENGRPGGYPYTGNGGAASVKGVELEIQAIPLAGLHLGVYGNFNQAELSEDLPIASQGHAGDHIPYVPQVTATFNAEYEWPLPVAGLQGNLGAMESFTSSRNSEFRPDSTTFERFPAYSITTLRCGVKSEKWSVLVNVANVFNNNAPIADTPVITGLYPPSLIPNRPRTYSLTVSASL